MAWWVYKCNAQQRDYQRAVGDWSDFFAAGCARDWGSTGWVPELAKAKVGDTMIAYQTDRNELVGIARVKRWRRHGQARQLILEPVRIIGVKVRPLKDHAPRVRRIRALQSGPIRTLYPISRTEAVTLLNAAAGEIQTDSENIERAASNALRGAGFGTAEENKRVERAAVAHARRQLSASGWSVTDVSRENRGYDLLCRRGRRRLHVEVKGARGSDYQFILTDHEKRVWGKDAAFSLAFVPRALSRGATAVFFSGPQAQKEFAFRAISYVATRRSNK